MQTVLNLWPSRLLYVTWLFFARQGGRKLTISYPESKLHSPFIHSELPYRIGLSSS